jgi:hypothetical protein
VEVKSGLRIGQVYAAGNSYLLKAVKRLLIGLKE